MSLQAIKAGLGQGGTGLSDLKGILTELQGLNVTVVAGAAAGTKMNIAAMRTEDTIVGAVVSTNAGGALADDKANITIQSTKASGTVTAASITANDTVTVNGVVYTFKTTPGAPYTDVALGGSNTEAATNLAAAINLYEQTRSSGRAVVATSSSAVVTVTAVVDGTAGNSIVLTSSNGTRLAVTGSGTLTNGTATGGIKSTTDLSSKSVIVFWFNKQ